MSDREVTFADIERALEARDPQLAELVIAYMEQPDPSEDRPEDGDEADKVDLGEDAWTMHRLSQALSPWMLRGKDAREQWTMRKEAWDNLQGARFPPPRLRLAGLLVDLYESGDEAGRDQLIQIFKNARVAWGLWKAFKTIYKRTEERMDARMFGALAWRLDALVRTPLARHEVGMGTVIYMRRRAWRYLRELGRALPEVYVQFAVEVLTHYPADFNFWGAWVANQIWGHGLMLRAGKNAPFHNPPDKLEKRAYHEAWKVSPEPLLRLLEDSPNGVVCGWVIRCLQADFPETLREVDPAWLARLGAKRGGPVHDFVVKLLTDRPEFHQSKLAGLGLHDLVLSLLDSESDAARKYAVAYASSHAPQIPVARLAELTGCGHDDAQKFALSRLEKLDAKTIGLAALVKLMDDWTTQNLATKKFEEGFALADIDAEAYILLFVGGWRSRQTVDQMFTKAKKNVPAAFLQALLVDPRLQQWDRWDVLAKLEILPASEIGIDWIKQAILDARYRDAIAGWLGNEKLSGKDLDVEWVKGLVMRPALRNTAIRVLQNTKLVKPAAIGVGWLLAMARQADQELRQFAQNHLLMHFAPDDFASDKRSGIDRLFELVGGRDELEQVREFASLYLRLNHPDIGPTLQEARQLGVKPRLPKGAFTRERLEPLFTDPRPDVRRFAAAVGKKELLGFDDPALLYALVDSPHREPRVLAGELLLEIGQEDSEHELDPARWLDGARVFALAESQQKSTREVALTLVRRHYTVLGGAHKLAWLMESPDREVRLFAVRLLWEKHRPGASSKQGDAQRFDTTEALRQFLRDVMFGLPPGRMERREGSSASPDRGLSASESKRRLVSIVRDFSLEDAGFAAMALPVLEEFMYSEAKGEWHACVAALAQIRRTHPELRTALPEAKPYPPRELEEAAE